MTACTFDGTTVNSYEVRRFDMVGTAGAYSLEVTIACRTTSLTSYTALAAKMGRIGRKGLYSGKVKIQTLGGTKASLVINGNPYTNCYISGLSAAEASKSRFGVWEYTISFVRETA